MKLIKKEKLILLRAVIGKKSIEVKGLAWENFVARLEEKLELLEQTEKYFQDIDYSTFDKLHMLVRIDSFERTCEHCQYIDRNEAKLEVHLLIKLNHTCEIVVVWKNLPYGIPEGHQTFPRGAAPMEFWVVSNDAWDPHKLCGLNEGCGNLTYLWTNNC